MVSWQTLGSQGAFFYHFSELKMAENRKKRYVDDDIDQALYMEDAEAEYKRKNLGLYGYMYEFKKSKEECIKIFSEERKKNQVLHQACNHAEDLLARMGRPQDVYNIVKCAYTLETPLYGTFNSTTRDTLTFFDWHKFDYKGLWLLLHKACQDQGVRQPFPVYRGASREFHTKVGSVIKFKSFTSSTVNREVAFGFIDNPKGSTLFEISCTNGISLSDVSQFPDEAEFLILPHEGFKVTHVKKESNGLTIISLESQQVSMLF